MVTTGVLLRRLQRDPDLPGVGAVVLDEVHERQLDADLTLALLLDVRENLREDLLLVAMSATVEAERTAALLGAATPPGGDVPGALHPVAEVLVPAAPGVRRSDDRGVTPRLPRPRRRLRAPGAGRAGRRRAGVPARGGGGRPAVVRRLGGVAPTCSRCTAGSPPPSRTSR